MSAIQGVVSEEGADQKMPPGVLVEGPLVDAKLSPSYGVASSKLLEIGGLPVESNNGPEFNREAATRMMRDLFAPWVLDLGLSIESVATSPPPNAATDGNPLSALPRVR